MIAVSHWLVLLGRILFGLLVTAGLALFLAWMGGSFHHKIAPGEVPLEKRSAEGVTTFTVQSRREPVTVPVVASVQARRETEVSSQILARIREVLVDPGSKVDLGTELILLDDSELIAQQGEVMAALTAAEADREVRKRDLARLEKLLPTGGVTREEVDRARGALSVAEALVNRAREQVKRIDVQIGYTKIKATSPGIIADRFVEKGDLAVPGKPLLRLQDVREFELHASVPESLATQIQIGAELDFRIESQSRESTGTVREIVPLAQPASRSVLIKVSIPKELTIPLFSGMFARVSIPTGREENHMLIPFTAIQQVGQLELVDIVEEDHLVRRFVRTGQRFKRGKPDEAGPDIEILSGLNDGERVVIPPPAKTALPR